MIPDLHALSFIMRWLHVAGMTFMVGGAGLLTLTAINTTIDARTLVKFATAYEALFWIVLGVQVISGVGNMGAFGAALPLPATAWGAQFLVKLGIVLILILLSLVRSMFVLVAGNIETAGTVAAFPRMALTVYGGTVLTLLVILWLAVGLAHG